MGLIYQFCQDLTQFVASNFFRLQIYGRENMIEDGPVLLAMNHQSFLDPPLAAICCDREIHFLARKSLFKIPVLGSLLRYLNVIGVDRDGADMSALKTVIRVVRAGGTTIIFPEGTRTSDGALQSARSGVGLVVAKTRAPVVPIRIFGAFDAFPRWSKFPRRRPITMVIGKPLRFGEGDFAGDPRIVYQRLSEAVMARIAELENPRRDED
jgi:1-acyl-sn-glycerol-3-phosphate acyltransferase